MKAAVFHGVGDIRLEDMAEPRIEQPTLEIVLTESPALIDLGETGAAAS